MGQGKIGLLRDRTSLVTKEECGREKSLNRQTQAGTERERDKGEKNPQKWRDNGLQALSDGQPLVWWVSFLAEVSLPQSG